MCSGISQVGQLSCELKIQASRMHVFKMESTKSAYLTWRTVARTPFLAFHMMPSLSSLRSEVNSSFKVKRHKGIAVSALLMCYTLFYKKISQLCVILTTVSSAKSRSSYRNTAGWTQVPWSSDTSCCLK